jgi:hypothetical protein
MRATTLTPILRLSWRTYRQSPTHWLVPSPNRTFTSSRSRRGDLGHEIDGQPTLRDRGARIDGNEFGAKGAPGPAQACGLAKSLLTCLSAGTISPPPSGRGKFVGAQAFGDLSTCDCCAIVHRSPSDSRAAVFANLIVRRTQCECLTSCAS